MHTFDLFKKKNIFFIIYGVFNSISSKRAVIKTKITIKSVEIESNGVFLHIEICKWIFPNSLLQENKYRNTIDKFNLCEEKNTNKNPKIMARVNMFKNQTLWWFFF